MTKREVVRGAMLVASCGMIFHSGACLGSIGGLLGPLLYQAAFHAGYEFLLDNDAVFDLFQDDFGTGATYDDRFTAAPTRGEP